jgi:D-alanyl-D-alanine carboxypeptidase
MKAPQLSSLVCMAAICSSLACSGDSPTETESPTLAEELQTALETTLSADGGTGVSAAVLIPGEEPWLGAAGISYGTAAITPQMILGVSSITKSYTATLVLHLAEEGVLSLEDSLQEWLPEFLGIDGTITIRQLLNHTSGVFDCVENPAFWTTLLGNPNRVWSPEEVIESFVGAPYFSPGAGVHYSNTGYLLLGMIVEEATGSTVSSNFRSLWAPLGLDRTFLDGEETINGAVAHPWSHLDGDGVLDDLSTLPRAATSSATWTAGAVFSTAGDLSEWARALFGGEIIGESSLDEMLTLNSEGYGLGTDTFGAEYFGVPAYGQVGSGLGYSGVMAYFPGLETSVGVLMNDNNLDCLFAIVSALVGEIRRHLTA